MSASSDLLTWLAGRLKDPFVSAEALPSYLAARRDDGSVYLYGRELTRAEADEITAALPSLLGGAAGLEAGLLSDDRDVATNALASATDAALIGLLHNVSAPVRFTAMTELDTRAQLADDARLAELLVTLEKDLLALMREWGRDALVASAQRHVVGNLARRGLTSERHGAVRLAAIRCLLRVSPGAASEFTEAPLEERLAVVEALRGAPQVMNFLLDEDEGLVAMARQGLAALAAEDVVAYAVWAMEEGSTEQRLSSLVAVEPLLVSRWRALFEPLVSLTKRSRGSMRVAAAASLGQLARGRRLSRKHVELVVKVLEAVPEERETVTTLRRLLAGPAEAGDPVRAMELQLEAGGSDESWAVYGDALLSAGDVRGELVTTSANPTRFKAALTRHRATVFGALDGLLAEDFPQLLERLTWRHGFIERAFVSGIDDVSLEEALEALLGAPVARFLSQLELGLSDPHGHDNDYADAIARIGDSGGAHLLRTVLLGTFDDEQAQMSWAPWGDVSSLWATCPSLVEVRVRGLSGLLGDVRAEQLESLTVETGGLSREALDSIASAKLPHLKHLAVWFGDSGYGGECELSDAERLLARKDRHLISLGLKNAEFTHTLLPILAKWKRLRQLEVLDLSLGVLTDEDVDVLLEKKEAFAHLRQLDLRGNALGRRIKEVRKALPNALVDEQRETDGMRYVAVGE